MGPDKLADRNAAAMTRRLLDPCLRRGDGVLRGGLRVPINRLPKGIPDCRSARADDWTEFRGAVTGAV
jgi:hypothetical protein